MSNINFPKAITIKPDIRLNNRNEVFRNDVRIMVKARACTFVNKGTTLCYVNGYPLAPGETWVLHSYVGEIIDCEFNLKFENTANGVNEVWCLMMAKHGKYDESDV